MGIWWRENKNKSLGCKALVDIVETKGANLKKKFCSWVLRLFELPRFKERLQTAVCRLAWLGKLKCLATGLDASLSFLSSRESVLGIGRQSSSCFTNVQLFAISASYAVDAWHWRRCAWSDQRSLWLFWVPKFSLRYEWKDKFCIVSERIWKCPTNWSKVSTTNGGER